MAKVQVSTHLVDSSLSGSEEDPDLNTTQQSIFTGKNDNRQIYLGEKGIASDIRKIMMKTMFRRKSDRQKIKLPCTRKKFKFYVN